MKLIVIFLIGLIILSGCGQRYQSFYDKFGENIFIEDTGNDVENLDLCYKTVDKVYSQKNPSGRFTIDNVTCDGKRCLCE